MAERTGQLLALDKLCKQVGERWLAVTGLPVESNCCVFAARVMACTTSIHTSALSSPHRLTNNSVNLVVKLAYKTLPLRSQAHDEYFDQIEPFSWSDPTCKLFEPTSKRLVEVWSDSGVWFENVCCSKFSDWARDLNDAVLGDDFSGPRVGSV